MKKIFIIIVHFGDPLLTKRCIESIHRVIKLPIIVVDNQGNFSWRKDKRVTLLPMETNCGYAKAVNAGIRLALLQQSSILVILNNDVTIFENVFLPLIRVLEKKEIGIAGPVIQFRRNDHMVFDCGGEINMLAGRTTHRESKEKPKGDIQIVDYISGCFLMVKKEVIDTIDMFDESFFMYYEDVDFCLRARNHGFQTAVLTSVSVFHALSSSIGAGSKQALYYQTKSALMFGRKHMPFFGIFTFIFVLLQSLYLLIKNPNTGIAAFQALL